MPKISVNLVTYNRAPFLTQAIESVKSQNFSDWELIIIDDGSTDQTKEIIEKYLIDNRIHYFKNEKNLGISASRNRALKESNGEYIAILDSDDFWIDNKKLERQNAWLDSHKDYVLVGTRAIVVDEKGQEINRLSGLLVDKEIKQKLLLKNPLIHSSVVYRRDKVLAVGAYGLNLDGFEDYDLWLKLGLNGKFCNLPFYDTGYRQHRFNISSLERLKLMTGNMTLIKKYRQNYPRFYRALIRRWLRLQIVKMITKMKIIPYQFQL